MRAGIGEFLHSMAGLPPPLLVIVREKTGARQGPRKGRRSPEGINGQTVEMVVFGLSIRAPRDNSRIVGYWDVIAGSDLPEAADPNCWAVQMMPGSALFRDQQTIHEISAGKAPPHAGKAAKKAHKFRPLLLPHSPHLFFLTPLPPPTPPL